MRAHPHQVGRGVALAAFVALFLMTMLPIGVSAATPGPSEPCVAGTIWEDLSSGVKYICVYDELYGGTRWELLSSGQTGSSLFTYRSSIYGCTFNIVALSLLSGGGGNSMVRSFRWPCVDVRDRTSQPPGELRVRTVLQRFGSSWANCRDTGLAVQPEHLDVAGRRLRHGRCTRLRRRPVPDVGNRAALSRRRLARLVAGDAVPVHRLRREHRVHRRWAGRSR